MPNTTAMPQTAGTHPLLLAPRAAAIGARHVTSRALRYVADTPHAGGVTREDDRAFRGNSIVAIGAGLDGTRIRILSEDTR
jgi:hypothetical protein